MNATSSQNFVVSTIATPKLNRIRLVDIGREPFRIFFPCGVLAGVVGVALWPLYFGELIRFYPGQPHARIMACGLFGAFILGFLGTAMPRLLSAPPLGIANVAILVTVHAAMVVAFATGQILVGDALHLGLLITFIILMVRRARHREDTPPPGFLLVGLAFLCAVAGATIALFQPWNYETAARWTLLQRLLAYQGFVLLPILGIGPFLLPRFFGMVSPHDLAESLTVSKAWKAKAALALGAGLLIIASFFIEVAGWVRAAHAIRFATALAYIAKEFPFKRAPGVGNSLGVALRVAFVGIVAGFLFVALFPVYRVSLLHLTLIGGFGVITFTVATRVVFGHSGNLDKLKGRNRWLLVAIGLMLFGMATRISGDLWPKVLASHYIYGAILWILGIILWSLFVLPKILQIEPE